jgi:uncharacterized protein (TIGR03437 family)
MNRSRLIVTAQCATLLAVVPAIIYAHRTGAPARSTGAPGDRGTCSQTQCHVGSQPGQQVTITYSGGSSYTPGQRGKFTVTISDTDTRGAYGFEASARLGSNLQGGQAGTLHAGAGQHVICEDDRTPPCRDTAPVQFVTHDQPRTTNAFEFEWTPPATDSGEIRVYVAGNAANGNREPTGDRIHTASILLTPATGARPSITEGGIVDPWTRKTALAPGTWVEIYGQNFASSTQDWSNAIEFGALPTTLNGVSVTIGNKPAALSLVAPGQVNALIPADAGTGDVPVVVKTRAGESAPIHIRLSDISPVLFAPVPAGNDRYHAFLVDNSTAALYGASPASRPARPGDIVQLYALGLGPTNPPLITDRLAPVAAVANVPTVRFGEVAAELFGAVLIAPGLYQINLRVPDVEGELPLTVEIGGQRSPGNTMILVRR